VQVDASDNWFGTDGKVIDDQDSSTVTADYETLSQSHTVELGTNQFAAITEFDYALAPGQYSLTTEVIPN
jgi:hypothetical protein